MGHRINVWIQRLLVPVAVVATLVMLRWGLGVLWTLAVVLPILAALMLVMVVVDPGPRAKGFVEGLKSRFR
jgi:hypothetical protein